MSRAPIPVTILSGYLGAGKTTLLNTILVHPQFLRIFALVNDFGEVNLDATVISQVTDDVIALTNGCACCSLGNDLSRAFEKILSTDAIDAVLIEASGVANLSRLSSSSANYPGFVFNQSVTLVDALSIKSLLSDKYVATTVAEQIASADKLMINRCHDDAQLFAQTLSQQPVPETITTAEFLNDLRSGLGVDSMDSPRSGLNITNVGQSNESEAFQDHQLTTVFIPTTTDVSLDELREILDSGLNKIAHTDSSTDHSALIRLKGHVRSGHQQYSVQFSRSGYEILASAIDISTPGVLCMFVTGNERLSEQANTITTRLRDWALIRKEP